MVALLCPPPPEEPVLPNPFARLASRWATLSRTGSELLVLAIALGFGFLVLPWIIWIVGQAVLGPYARGGALQFVRDFFVGLGHGNGVFWIIALGPVTFLVLARLILVGLRRRPAGSPAAAAPD